MSDCRLQIHFDHPDRTYATGQKVRGHVSVETDAVVKCDGLHLRAIWETHGRGNVDREDVAETLLFRGRWNSGEEASYPFEFTAPAFPPTIRGRSINLDHYVEVRADVPWAFDPKAKEDYLLLASGSKGRSLAKSMKQEPGSVAPAGNLKGALIVVLLFAMAILAFILPKPIGVLVMLAGIGLGARALARISASKRIGNVRVRVLNPQVRAGQSIGMDVVLQPTAAVAINEVVVGLIATEVCISGSGTNRSTHKRVVSKQSDIVQRNMAIARGHKANLSHQIQVPADGLPSFISGNNRIEWRLSLELKLKGLSDWKREWLVCVDPLLEDLAAGQRECVSPPAFPVLTEEPAEVVSELLSEGIYAPESLAAASEEPALVREGEFDRPELALGEPSVPEAEAAMEGWEEDDSSAGEADAEVVIEPEPELEPEPEAAIPALSGFALVFTSIQALDRFGDERKSRIADELGQKHEFEMRVERVKWTYGDVGQDYAKGRVLAGKLQPDDLTIEVRLPEALNALADALRPGSRVRVRARLATWNATYGSPEFEAPEFELLEAP
ncbi:MAG: hypothetical protein ACI9K5_002559 [Gammaproteobacteria bacterium]|jgi:hypothetical protein